MLRLLWYVYNQISEDPAHHLYHGNSISGIGGIMLEVAVLLTFSSSMLQEWYWRFQSVGGCRIAFNSNSGRDRGFIAQIIVIAGKRNRFQIDTLFHDFAQGRGRFLARCYIVPYRWLCDHWSLVICGGALDIAKPYICRSNIHIVVSIFSFCVIFYLHGYWFVFEVAIIFGKCISDQIIVIAAAPGGVCGIFYQYLRRYSSTFTIYMLCSHVINIRNRWAAV